MKKHLDFSSRIFSKWNFMRIYIPWVVLGLWAGITFLVWTYAQREERDRLVAQFEREAQRLVEMTRGSLSRYEDTLSAAVAMIHSQSFDLTGGEWQSYVHTMDFEQHFPGVSGLALVYRIPKKRLSRFVQEHRVWRPDFNIFPDREAEEYFPLTYIEPLAPNKAAVGLDLGYEENRREALKRAEETGLSQLSAPLVLVQDELKQPSVIFMKAFYKHGNIDVFSPSDFGGVVSLPFVVKDLMRGLSEMNSRLVRTRISDGGTVLYDESLKNIDAEQAPLKKTLQVPMYGRTWDFDIWSTPRLHFSRSDQPSVILAAGIMIGVLLFLLLQYMARAHLQALRIAEELGEEAKTQRAIALNASKMASLGQMAAGIAHEINNPLTTLRANASIIELSLKRGDPDSLQTRRGLAAIKSTVDRMAEIVIGLRMITRKDEQAAVEKVNLSETWKLTCGFTMDRLDRANIRVENQLDPRLWIWAKRTHISQVLLNLLSNSIDAVEELPRPWIKIESKEGGGSYRIYFVDSGPGIPAENRESLFDPFFTTKETGKGTGLGLSICAGIIATYGGRMYYDEQASNTTFVIELPKPIEGEDYKT